MTWSRRVGPGGWFFLLVGAGLVVAGRELLFRDPGTFWHVRTGERILDTAAVPRTDPFTFPFGGRPWVAFEWLADVGMAVVYRAAGPDGLLLLSAGLIAGAFAVPFGRLVRAGFHPAPAGCLVGLAVAASASHFHARPHLATLLFLTVLVARLTDFDAGRVGLRGLVWVVPLFTVWANLHGGALGGLGTAGLAVGGWLTYRAIGWPGPVRGFRDGLLLAAWLAGLGAAVVVNPFGLDLPRTWLAILGMADLRDVITEHASLDPLAPSGWPFLALGGVYAAGLAGLRERPRVAWLLPAAWFVLGCERVRHASLFAVTASVALADFLPRTVWVRRLAGRPDLFGPPGLPAPPNVWLPAAVVLLAAVAAVGCWQTRPAEERAAAAGGVWARFPAAEWPLALAPDLDRLSREPGGGRVFTEYVFGGFVIYFAPAAKPFIDDRCEVFGGAWVRAFVAADADPGPALARWEREYGPWGLALTRPGSGFDGWYRASPDWQHVAGCESGNLYRKR